MLIEHDTNANRATVRNRLVEQTTSEWIVTLDADDELAPGYVAAIRRTISREQKAGRKLLLTPAVSYIHRQRERPARFWNEIDLRKGNWMVVGTALRKSLFVEVGGWKHLDATGVTNEYDDWHLWCRCALAGAEPVKVPDAIYRAHVMTNSGHRTASRQRRLEWHREVEIDIWGAATV